MPRFLTVVYTINDDEKFSKERADIMKKFQESNGKPWAITAMSLDHEIGRLSLIEEAAARGGVEALELIEGIIAHPKIGQFETLVGFEDAEA